MKNIILNLVLASSFCIGFAPVALADRYGDGYNRFAAELRSPETLNVVDVLPLQSESLPPDTLMRLRAIAFDQAQIWADTILEGDYRADGSTSLDRIAAVMNGGNLIAYRIVYSERSWRLDNELEGRIVEASYVAPDLQSWMRDDRAYASFEESSEAKSGQSQRAW